MNKLYYLLLSVILLISLKANTQSLVINEGSNKNYQSVGDEDQEYPDWIEIYNNGSSPVNLLNYSLTDDSLDIGKWKFPNIIIQPGEYKVVFCSGKDRKPISGFKQVFNQSSFNPVVGWNTHNFVSPFVWDGVSNVLINIASYANGYTTNSVFRQSTTPFLSTLFVYQDGSSAVLGSEYGFNTRQRPNLRLNNRTIGTGNIQNSDTDYPAPYGNWYWAAKHQILVLASELSAAGLTAGNINSLAFDVVSTDPNTVYDYININFKAVTDTELSTFFQRVDSANTQHTNFKISSNGEKIYLYSPLQTLLSSLEVKCQQLDNSVGSFPDASANISIFATPTPRQSNNSSSTYSTFLQDLSFSVPSGIYNSTLNISINNPNGLGSSVYYTLDGKEPTTASLLYTGAPINIFYSQVLKAKAFSNNNTVLPSKTNTASYLIGINHFTPVLSLTTDRSNLYGTNGIFDNWAFDWQKAAYVEYFDTSNQLIFSQNAGIQIDGGWGGSRSQPQHSFRIELDNSALGEGSIQYPLIPNRPNRTKYSNLYLRNGSNQYLSFPYKDACQVEMMASKTKNYYSAWRPVTVYINGEYFGLYELREKFDEDYFEEQENANPDSIEVMSLSAWNSFVLHAVQGSVDSFYTSYNSFTTLNTNDTAYWTKADRYFDMEWYNDYIIAESWMGNVDWPGNNIKIYRSDKTNHRWRFCLIDLELSLAPGGWTDFNFDHIQYLLSRSTTIPAINIWLRSIQNAKFKRYFINRFADLMNTAYKTDKLLAIENSMFNQTVLEMPKEYARWGNPGAIAQQMTDFNNNHLSFQNQLSNRTAQVRNHINSNFSLNGQVDLTLEVQPQGAGKIRINTIVPDSLPWTGVYFNGNPVTLTAIPNPGFQFEYWDANNIISTRDTNEVLDINVFANATFRAFFTVDSVVGKLAISELNYHSDSTRDAGDWIEFHNYGNGALNISGWTMRDGNPLNQYIFPQGTILQPNQYLVLVSDSIKFKNQHPAVAFSGQFPFSFSNAGELVRIIDGIGTMVLEMNYLDSLPWQMAADGFGKTLELVQDSLDPNLPSSWFAGCTGGSPGGPFVPCSENIVFSEINYNSNLSKDAGDWVEIYNAGNTTINLSSWYFSDADDSHFYIFPQGTNLPAAAYLVIYGDQAKFNSRFPNLTNKIGPFNFGLSSSGEAIRLFDASGKLYQSMVYDENAPWPAGANGNGYTLEIIDKNGLSCDGTNWQDGCEEGSPGTSPTFPCTANSVSQTEQLLQLKLYPNPNHGQFLLDLGNLTESDKKVFVEIYNLLGEKIYHEVILPGQKSHDIELEEALPGVYFVKVTVGNVSRSLKMVVKGG